MLTRGPFALALLATAGTTAAGCGSGGHFKDAPRPPTPVQLTGVITANRLTVSPNRIGAGPIRLIISNQTQQAHTITLSGSGGSEKSTVGPVNPLDTATIQQNLVRGKYTVQAGSSKAVAKEPKSAIVSVGPPRKDSSDQVGLP